MLLKGYHVFAKKVENIVRKVENAGFSVSYKDFESPFPIRHKNTGCLVVNVTV